MTELDGMISNDTLALLREKWGLADEGNKDRASFTAIILDNQSRHFQRLIEDTRAIWGPDDWRATLFDSLKSRLMTHPLFDICAMQPMTGPVGIVYFYRPRSGTTVMTNTDTGEEVRVPELVLDIAPATITAEPRKMKALRDWGDGTDATVEGLLDEISREIIGTMMNCMTDETVVESVLKGETLEDQVSRASHVIHRRSQRAPANRLVANAEMLTKLGVECPEASDDIRLQDLGTIDEGKRRVFLDPLFPKGQILVWYHGQNVLDTGIIYSPYIMFEITPNFVNPEDQTLRRAIRVRHKITVVRPEFSYLIKTETA